ncbi:MAG TPA: hypothetical protein VGH40_11100 [Roseiarcus sp.]|jgi:hypothetical protein
MCALCGVLGGKDHWTEPLKRDGVYVRFSDPARRRRERALRVREANAILGLFGLSLDDWHADSYVLRTRTGKSEVVADLAALWPAAEKLVGRGLDPLAEDVLERRERLNG